MKSEASPTERDGTGRKAGRLERKNVIDAGNSWRSTDYVERAFGVWFFEMGGSRKNIVRQWQKTRGKFNGASRSHEMSDCTFDGADRNIAKQSSNGFRFGRVIQRRACPVRIDIANVGRLKFGTTDRSLHRRSSS